MAPAVDRSWKLELTYLKEQLGIYRGFMGIFLAPIPDDAESLKGITQVDL